MLLSVTLWALKTALVIPGIGALSAPIDPNMILRILE